jgi:CheY-like chemotaxis protein
MTKPRVICVDDEPQVLESLRDTLRRRFDVTVTTNGFEALRMLASEPFAVVLSDMRMPRLNGSRFLTLAREHAPDTVRLLLTGQSSVDDAVAAVNDGEIFRFLLKPCPPRALIEALDSAAQRHHELRRDRELADQSRLGVVKVLRDLAATWTPPRRPAPTACASSRWPSRSRRRSPASSDGPATSCRSARCTCRPSATTSPSSSGCPSLRSRTCARSRS